MFICTVWGSKVVSSEKPIGSFTHSHSGLFIHFYSVKKSSYPLNLETFKNTEIIRCINIYTLICLSNYHITYISILGLKICQLNLNVSCCHNELMEEWYWSNFTSRNVKWLRITTLYRSYNLSQIWFILLGTSK